MTQFDTLRLDALVSSPTNPRKNFNPVKLQELADSIAASGVHQPILVRPLPAQRLADTAHLKPRPTHEIVAGERRYRASQLAKVDTIPAMIRALTDDQVLEIQIVENIQRDSLTELETAEGYKTLMEHNHLTAEQVGQKVSKSRSSIYGSLKLLDLHPASKDALRSERITASAALLIARIPDIKLQDKAVAYAATPDGAGDKPSYRTFSAWLQRNVMLNLSYAPFDIEVVTLVPAAGSCNGCKKRTDADPDLFSDISNAALCIDPPCYHLKAESHKQVLANMIKAKAPMPNRNVDEQQGLGLVSTLAQDARAQQAKGSNTERDIEAIKSSQALDIHKAQRTACFYALIDHIYDCDEGKASSLLPVELLRAWLKRSVSDWEADDLAVALDLPPCGNTDIDEYDGLARLRIERADDAGVYRYMAAMLLLPDRDTYAGHIDRVKEPVIMNNFANALEIDLEPVRQEAADQVKAETKAKISDLNKQIKAKKTTSTPPPAGAASDDAAAGAKKSKPAALSRKAKTTAEEAISGIAAAMQGIEAEPLDAALVGSEAAAGDSGALAVGAKVKVLDGKHSGKQGVIRDAPKNDMWAVTFGSGACMFTANLPTKSLTLQVIA